MLVKILNKLPGSMHYLWAKYHCDLQKNETILILISLKRYFSHPENSILNLKGTATLMITMFYMKDLNKP